MISDVNHGVRQSWGRPQAESVKTGNKVNRSEKPFSSTSQSLSYSQSVNYSSGNYSYSSQVEVRYDSVSIGSNGAVSPLHSFFNNLAESMDGLFDMGGMIDPGYGSMDSPFAFAGQLLNRIKAGLAGEVSGGDAVAGDPPLVPEIPVTEVGGTVAETAPGPSPPEAVKAPVGDESPGLVQMIEKRVELGYQKTVVELQARENSVVPEKSEKKQEENALVPVNKARSLLRHGLRSLRQNVNAPAPVGSSHGFVAGESEARNMSLQVFTRDGDLVNIEIGSARSAFMGGGETGDGSSYNMFVGAMAGGLKFSVEGDLDDGELGAIAELLGDVNDLAQTFFDSDFQAAFEMAMELGFDQDELTGFALDLNRQTTRFAAIREQGNGGNMFGSPEDGGAGQRGGVQPIFDTINGFADMARNLMNHAILDLFEQPTSFVTNMFDGLTLENLFDSDGTAETPENQPQVAMGKQWVQDLLSQMASDKNGEIPEFGEPEEIPGADGARGIDRFL